ncbi:MAG: hypothetical protein PSX81_07475 [bacterium]|nr:hypothetical protein [bacterium]
MKKLPFLILLIVGLSACCDKIYIPYEENVLQINLFYGKKGFSKNDTVFNVTFYYNRIPSGGKDSFSVLDYTNDIYYTVNIPDSSRQIAISSYDYYKIKIESQTTSFVDSITNIGFSYKENREGSRRCGYNRKTYFDVRATYKNTVYNSGSNSNLAIMVKPN